MPGSLVPANRTAQLPAYQEEYTCVSAPMPSRYEAFWSTNPLPYTGADAQELRDNPAAVVERYWPGIPAWFEARGATISPVPVIYDLTRGAEILGWTPKYSFDSWWKEHAHEL